MTSAITVKPVSSQSSVASTGVWAGRVLSAVPALFLLFDATIHITKPVPVVEGFARLGYPLSVAVPLAAVELVTIALYILPRTSILGAILLTGYLGGAVATHVRVSDPVFDIIFPVIFGAVAWAGLYLRNPRLRELIPVERKTR